jgi:hypothetical protein
MGKDIFRISIKENLIKNFLIIVLVFLFYNNLRIGLKTIDSNQISDFLLVTSMLLVTVCFANFAFSYEFTKIKSLGMRLLSHISTFIFMLLIALLLESLVISIGIVYPSLFAIILTFSLLLYLGIALYDFWDFFRVFNR